MRTVTQFSVRRLVAVNAPTATATAARVAVQARWLNPGASVQRRTNKEQQDGQRFTEYDYDKERWAAQMKFSSMDCILDPDIRPKNYTSTAGIRKVMGHWLTMKKLSDRRPDFRVEDLREMFVKYKELAHTKDLTKLRTIIRITTFTEAKRIEQDMQKSMDTDFKKTSWKAFNAAMADSYQMEVEEFQIINVYMGQMTQDDWIQLTAKVVFKERKNDKEEWASVVEYPVFEVKLGDGVKTANTSPFIIVAVMNKDGNRFGRDAQDSAALRKNFTKAKKGKGWLGSLFG
jgi:hypothetical protein